MFTTDALSIDPERVASVIEEAIRAQILGTLRRRGAVVGLSGGIDSSVVATLCTRALGPERVVGLVMPERDSSSDALTLGRLLASHIGITAIVEDIAPVLRGAGCYARQDEAILQVFPEYRDGYRYKVTLPSILESNRFNLSELTIEGPSGDRKTARMPLQAYLQLIAATNFKQRARTMLEYYHADRLNYAVAGTPNRLEYDQGFFVKHGDGAADLKPIAHLYKTQVYALAGAHRRARRDPPSAADHRHLLAAAVAGGVLLLAALRQDGRVPVRAQPRRPGCRCRLGHRPYCRAGRARLRGHRPEAPDNRVPAHETAPCGARSRGCRLMCGIPGVVALRDGQEPPCVEQLAAMAGALRHRGPNDAGVYRDERAGFSHARLSTLAQDQLIEIRTLLSGYLLSAQGDWMLMANSVEGRFPYLDLEVARLADSPPPSYKVHVLDEKRVLKRVGLDTIPREIRERTKQPHRAPEAMAFSGPDRPAWVAEVTTDQALADAGVFDSTGARLVLDKCFSRGAAGQFSNADNMAVVGILSTQLVHDNLIRCLLRVASRPVLATLVDRMAPVGAAEV